MIDIVNTWLSMATIVSQIIIAVIVVLLLIGEKKIIGFISTSATLFAFFIALGATVGSLFYSEIMAYTPCALCWWQRMFMYPQVVLLGIALWKNDAHVRMYSGTLAVIGGGIALYHSLLQIGLVPSVLCATEGDVVSCAQRLVFEFGYVTLPLMSLSMFALIVLLMFVSHVHGGRLE